MKCLLKLYINYFISEFIKKIIIELIENDNLVYVGYIYDIILFEFKFIFLWKGIFLWDI